MEIVHERIRQSKGLAALRLQNHLYGCFLVMEDLATRTLIWQGGSLQGNGFTLEMGRDFGWLGVRYGFMMDRGLVVEDAEYQAVWHARFAEVSALEGGAAQAAVDATEDALLVTLREHAEPFFVQALATGALPQPLIEHALRLLMGADGVVAAASGSPVVASGSPAASSSPSGSPSATSVSLDQETPPLDNRLTHATAEKPLRQRILSHTFRHRVSSLRGRATRRAHGTRK